MKRSRMGWVTVALMAAVLALGAATWAAAAVGGSHPTAATEPAPLPAGQRVAAGGATPQAPKPTWPPPVQTAEAERQARYATAEAQPRPPKQPEIQVTSCPRPAITPRVGEILGGPPPASRDLLLHNVAGFSVPDGRQYKVFGGASKENPQQGVLVVVEFPRDPCASHNEPVSQVRYRTPMQDGEARLTEVNGVVVTFTTIGGSTGRFNVVTKEFLP